MTQSNRCPECESDLLLPRGGCLCGWKQVEKTAAHITDHRCEYRDAGKRCDERGRMAHSSKGNWYCTDHYHQVRNSRIKDADNRSVQKSQKAKQDWRRELWEKKG